MAQDDIFYILDITTFQGISMAGIHYYGKLCKISHESVTPETAERCSLSDFSPHVDNSIKIQKPLSRKGATKLNKKDDFLSLKHEAGEWTNRFNDMGKLIQYTQDKYIRGNMNNKTLVILFRGREHKIVRP